MKLKICAIYMWTNIINGKKYIGQTIDLHRRLRTYKSGGFKNQKKLYNAFMKYSIDNFKFDLLYSSTVIDLDALNTFERDFIYLYDTLGVNGYNLKEGGRNGLLSKSTKDKIRKSMTGKTNGRTYK